MLQKLGLKYGSERGDANHTCDGLSYLDVYDHYFRGIRRDVKTLLEIGVRDGNGMKMWKDYFPNATIYGLDIDPNTPTDLGSRMNVIIGDQSEAADLDRIAPGRLFDIIIDDGSHLAEHLQFTYKHLFDRVRPGGYYVMESTTLCNGDLTDIDFNWPGQCYNKPETNHNNDRAAFNAFLLDEMHQAENNQRPVSSVTVRFNMIWFKKRRNYGK